MTQRLRITFSATGAMRYVAHLDTMRTWERAIRRANLPLVYTHGFSPHARIALAAPLPVGVVGLSELMDIWLDPPLPPLDAARRLMAALPPGLAITAADEVPDALPALQASLRAARYEVWLPPHLSAGEARVRLAALLALDSLDWEEARGEKTRRYDLRATILDLAVRAAGDGGGVLELHLSLEVGRTGRPVQVLAAMEIDGAALEIVRVGLELDPAAEGVAPRPRASRGA